MFIKGMVELLDRVQKSAFSTSRPLFSKSELMEKGSSRYQALKFFTRINIVFYQVVLYLNVFCTILYKGLENEQNCPKSI